MDNVKISAVSYLNTKPFIYGIVNYKHFNNYSLSLDIPAVCAQKLLTAQVDIGLVPVAAIPDLSEYYILSDYCIGASGAVTSVMLYSEVPLSQIKAIYLDYQSRTSVALVRLLAEKFWVISPQWLQAHEGFEAKITATTAGVVIGDRTFKLNGCFKYSYDLAAEWYLYTGLPFVFACWVANKKLPEATVASFNSALKFGVDHIDDMIKHTVDTDIPDDIIRNYLTKNIQYHFDQAKEIALKTFLQLIQEKKQLNRV